MNTENFDPALEAVAKIRQLSIGLSNDWSQMKSIGNRLLEELLGLTNQIHFFGNEQTKKDWDDLVEKHVQEVKKLRQLLLEISKQIQEKKAEGLSEKWNGHQIHSTKIAGIYKELKSLGASVVPQNKREAWQESWINVEELHREINRVADACYLQTQLIEQIAPEELNDLTDQILKHIPKHYSVEKAQEYEQDYRKAYQELKKEASKKKNLWDKFLDVLAGGVQQSASERVMLQRWVDGEKGEL